MRAKERSTAVWETDPREFAIGQEYKREEKIQTSAVVTEAQTSFQSVRD